MSTITGIMLKCLVLVFATLVYFEVPVQTRTPQPSTTTTSMPPDGSNKVPNEGTQGQTRTPRPSTTAAPDGSKKVSVVTTTTTQGTTKTSMHPDNSNKHTVEETTRGHTRSSGPTCITDCSGMANGDYQSCQGCSVYVTCSNELTYDNRPCAPTHPGQPPLVWDDNKKRCEWTSDTCVEASLTAMLSITCDNILEGIYIDGERLQQEFPEKDSIYTLDHVDFPASARSIAVVCRDLENGWRAGILAHTTTGLDTDSSGSWRCTSSLEPDWTAPDFDDSHWPVALVTGNNGEWPRGIRLPDVGEANYIWARYPAGKATRSYCRAQLP